MHQTTEEAEENTLGAVLITVTNYGLKCEVTPGLPPDLLKQILVAIYHGVPESFEEGPESNKATTFSQVLH